MAITTAAQTKAQQNLKEVQGNSNLFIAPTTKLLDFVGKSFTIPVLIGRSEDNVYLYVKGAGKSRIFINLPWVDEDDALYAESDRSLLNEAFMDTEESDDPALYVSVQYRELSPEASDARVNTFLAKHPHQFIEASLDKRMADEELPQSIFGLKVLFAESGLAA